MKLFVTELINIILFRCYQCGQAVQYLLQYFLRILTEIMGEIGSMKLLYVCISYRLGTVTGYENIQDPYLATKTLDVYESVKYSTIQTDRSREHREWKQLKCSEINGIWEATGSRRRSLIDSNREK